MAHDFIKVAIPHVGEEEAEAVRQVLLNGRYANGPIVERFEQKFADFVHVKHAVAVNSGTAALHIALEAKDIGPGDEVVVPPMTFFATIASVLYVGATPVFADVDTEDLCMSPESLSEVITNRTRAVIPVHFMGGCAKMDPIMNIAAHHDLFVLEDAAQSHGTLYKGRQAGSIGHAGAFSFFATKHMTTGEGGIITTNDEELANAAKCIRSHGMIDRDTHIRLGYNNRMTEIEAAIGLVQLTKLENLNRRRRSNSQYLLEAIRELPWAQVPVPMEHVDHTFFWCPIMVKKDSGRTMAELKEHLSKNNIGFRHRYTEPLYKQPVLAKQGLDYSKVFLPNAEEASGNVIGLPNHPGLEREALDRVLYALQTF